MTINYIKADLFISPDKVIVHGCNTAGVMGSGVAKIVKEKYPKAFDDYHQYVQKAINTGYGNSSLLGWFVASDQPDGKIIVNAFTQNVYGRGMGIRFASYDAIDDAMLRLMLWCEEEGHTSISMPKIGAGLGGGCWEVIEAIIKNRFEGQGITVNVYYLE